MFDVERDASADQLAAGAGSPDESARQASPPPFRSWQIAALLLLVVLCDLTIYRGQGYAGLALLCLAGPVLMGLVSFRPRGALKVVVLGALLALLAVRLAWWGSWLQTGLAFSLLVAFAMSLSGVKPFVVETVLYVLHSVGAGYAAMYWQWHAAKQKSPSLTTAGFLAVALPAMAFVAFGSLFVLANPDLAEAFGTRIATVAAEVRAWLVNFGPNIVEVLFCFGAFWICAGLLRPIREVLDIRDDGEAPTDGDAPPAEAALYASFRNTLLTVIGLFAVYLVFEFKTLWFRVFPTGFYYSGYAHEGAFWLTIALALTTLTLSLAFRGRLLNDPRLTRLKRLAWIWSLENLLLAAAVYHRLSIYIGFNGMTRMRAVGFCGISAVVVGFGLVIWKIVARRDFAWLIRRQMWTLALFVYVYAVTPVDVLAMRYNTQRILAGDEAPSVQITVHPIDPGGMLQLLPLLESENETIREGVRALLARELASARARAEIAESAGWTARQTADEMLLSRLETIEEKLRFRNARERDAAFERFADYAYQWF